MVELKVAMQTRITDGRSMVASSMGLHPPSCTLDLDMSTPDNAGEPGHPRAAPGRSLPGNGPLRISAERYRSVSQPVSSRAARSVTTGRADRRRVIQCRCGAGAVEEAAGRW